MTASKAVRHRLADAYETLRAPRVELRLSRSPAAHRRHAQLSARHPTLRVVPASFGSALMPLPDSMDEYLGGASRRLLRRKRRRAIAAGFRCVELHGAEHVGDMLAIHRSAAVRQGQPMHSEYLDELAVTRYADRAETLIGAIDAQGRLRAYASIQLLGEVGTFERLIGHAENLDDGVVYLVASEAVGNLIAAKRGCGLPTWAMCGALWGNGTGLAYFKRRLGFRPYRARFTLDDPPR